METEEGTLFSLRWGLFPVTNQETASTPPFADVHDQSLHNQTVKNEDIFENFTVCVSMHYTMG